ncbi:MAG TPA: TonB-dependent receptor [Bacteroidia bacterium]|nr:TonB-dependent receptor [Bacteroidia bacterium]
MIKRILIFICQFILSYTSYSQGVVRGRVTDKSSKETLPGVILICGDKNAITDVNGNFSLPVPLGKQVIKVSLVGYANFSKTIEVKDTITVAIALDLSNRALDEVVVSAGKYEQKLSEVTVSMEVIKADLLQNKAVVQLDQIMNQVPGVYITDQQVSIRGGSGFTYGAGSRVMMLVDGMPMISADAGDIKFNYIPIENMAQMEVIKGASSALYGSSALNGVINMRTKFAGDTPETQVTMMAGLYGNADRESLDWWKQQNRFNPMYQAVTFSHAQKLGNFDLVMGGQLYKDEGYRDSASENRVRANLNLRYRFKKIPGLSVGINSTAMTYSGNLFFLWKHADSAFQASPGTLSAYSNTRNNIDPYINYVSKKGGKHNLRGRYFLTNNTNSSGGANQSSRAEMYYSEYQWQKSFKNKFNITAGGVAMRQVVLSPALYGNRFGKNLAAYVQADKKFFNRLTVSGGMRIEYYKVDTSQTKGGFFLIDAPKKTNLPVQPVFRAGLNYQAFEYTFIRASFGQGYRFPSVAEKYISTIVGGINVYPNPALQPEKGYTAEVGIKQGFKIGNFQGFFDAAYFVTHYYNMIDLGFKYDTVGKSSQINSILDLKKDIGFQLQNVGSANITGVDLSISGTGKIGPIRVDLLSGYTYSNPINPNFNPKTDTSGTSHTNVLRYRNKTLFKNDIQLTYKIVSLGWSTRYTSAMQNIDRRFQQNVLYDDGVPDQYAPPATFLLPGLAQYRATHNTGVWVNDFRIGCQVSKVVRVSFLINNFFNTEFMSRPGLIEPPRTFILQAGLKF